MSSNYSVDTIHNTMLSNIDDAYQKTEGFPTYDITRGEAFALLELWKKAEERYFKSLFLYQKLPSRMRQVQKKHLQQRKRF